MRVSLFLSRTAALAGMLVVGSVAAHAQSITPVFQSVASSSGFFAYTYQLLLSADTRTTAGDLVTFYDFNGLQNGGAQAPTFVGQGGANYTISTPFLGVNPPGTTQLAGDDPTLENVTLTYSGPTLANTTATSESLGTLTLYSTNGLNGAGDFTAFAANSVKNSNSTPAGNQTFVSGPNLQVTATTPEPGSWALLIGLGMTGTTIARRRLRRK